jgi:hypothetical protein
MNGDVLGGFETGPARETDLDDVVRVLEEADRALGLPPEPIREESTWTWHLPTTNLERDTSIPRDADTARASGSACTNSAEPAWWGCCGRRTAEGWAGDV